MIKKLILAVFSIVVIVIFGYLVWNFLIADKSVEGFSNASSQDSIESFKNKFEQIKPFVQKRMAEQLGDTKSIGDLMEKIKEAKMENNLRRVNEYLDKGLEFLKVKLPETEAGTGDRFIEKAVQSKMKLFNDTVGRKMEVKQYNDKIGMILQRSVSFAKAGDGESANSFIDLAMAMVGIGPLSMSEDEKKDIERRLTAYYEETQKKFFTHDISRTLTSHDDLIDSLFSEVISYKDALSALEKMNSELKNAKELDKAILKPEYRGKLISPKNGGCYIGTWSQDPFHLSPKKQNVKKFEKITGAHVAIDYVDFFWKPWENRPANIDAPNHFIGFGPSAILLIDSIIAGGTVPALQIHPIDVNLQDIISGKYDDEIVRSAKLLKEFGNPLMLQWINEFDAEFATVAFGKDGKTSYLELTNSKVSFGKLKKTEIAFMPGFKKFKHDAPTLYNQYGDPSVPDGPERVRDTWRHIHDTFDEFGISNVTWYEHTAALHGNPKLPPESPYYLAQPWNKMKYYYPGDNYIDWVGISGYNKIVGTSVDTWNIFGSIKYWYDEVRSSEWKNKPLLLHEFSQIPDRYKSDLPQWIEKNLGEYIPKNFKSVNAFFWIINNFPLEEKDEIQAFKKYITNNEYYVQKPEFAADHTPPGRIKDLSARIDKGNIVLSWTAPGDDENEGEASYYIVKYRTDPVDNGGGVIKDFRKEPWRLWSRYETKDVEGEPKPQKAGSKEKMVIPEFKPGKYCFAIQSVDDVPYNSKISNIAEVSLGAK